MRYRFPGYFYEKNNHPWYRLWHRSQFYRDLKWAIHNWKYRKWLRFMVKHKYGWNADQNAWAKDYLPKVEIWPRY